MSRTLTSYQAICGGLPTSVVPIRVGPSVVENVTLASTTLPPTVTLNAMKLVKHWPETWCWQISAPVGGGGGGSTSTEEVPELGLFKASPEYVAVIVACPGPDSSYLTEHEPEASVHCPLAGENTLEALDDENVTVPVGSLPVTVAVQVVLPTVVMVEGVQDTLVELVTVVTVKGKLPRLPWLFVSPP